MYSWLHTHTPPPPPLYVVLCLFFTKINRGDYEGEVKIFGSSEAQIRAKQLIDELIERNSESGPNYNRNEQGRKLT